MKTLRTETTKPRMWLDPGIMITIDEEFGISAILYKRGFFSMWKIVSGSTNESDVEFLLSKIQASFGKSVRTTNDVVLKHEHELYRNLAINMLELQLSESKISSSIESIKNKYK